MSSRSRGFAAVLVGALVAALAVASFSFAHKRLFNTSTTFNLNKVSGQDTASGQLSSKKPGCLANRAVTVFTNTPPDKIFDASAIGKATTGSTGAWSLSIQGGVKKGNNYFARVSKRPLINNRRHKHTCKGVYSPKVVGQ